MDKVLSNVVLVETLHNLQIHLAELKKKFFLPLVLANYFQLHNLSCCYHKHYLGFVYLYLLYLKWWIGI